MIKTIKHKGLQLYFTLDDKRFLTAKDCPRICRLLDLLDAAMAINDMNLPGLRLHKLSGNKEGYWSVTVSRNYRLTFRFERGHAYDVNLEDYH